MTMMMHNGAGMLEAKDLPDEVRLYFGDTPSSMITAMVKDMVDNR